jgi:hypothetical protein
MFSLLIQEEVEKVIEGEGKTRRGSRQGEERREKRRE